MIPLRNRMSAVQAPVIPIVGELIRANPGTISLGQGIVHYPPPPQAELRVRDFFQDSENHKYKAVEGIAPLVSAINTKLHASNRIAESRERCLLVTAGANMAFMNAVLAITDSG